MSRLARDGTISVKPRAAPGPQPGDGGPPR